MKHAFLSVVALVAAPTPVTAQTMLDKLIGRIAGPRSPAPSRPETTAAVPAAQIGLPGADGVGGRADAFGTSAADVARIRAMDVAGVRLGMLPDQVRAALRAAGYSPTPDAYWTDRRPKVGRGFDYATRIDQVRRQRLRDFANTRVTETIVGEFWSKGDELVEVGYVPMRDGVRASRILYSIPEGRIGWEAIRSNVIARYGRPSRLSESLRSIRYCGDGVCAPVQARFARLELSGSWRLELTDGGALDAIAQRQAAADADALIAKTGRPSF